LAHAMVPGWAWGMAASVEVPGGLPIRASVVHFPESVERSAEGSVALTVSALELGVCESTDRKARVAALGCLALGTGVIHSAAYADVPRPPLERFWGALRGDLVLRLRLAGPLSLDARAVAWAPLLRWRFRVAGRPTVFRQPAVIPGATLVVGVDLW
jgi:hypothetical protein